MWALSAATRIYLAAGPTDLRKGFDGNGAKIRIFLSGNFGERYAFYDGVW